MPVILAPEQRWSCPNCTATDVTHEANPHSRMHACRGLKGLTAPMVPAGTACKVEAVERGDWIGKEDVTYDGDNRPIMSVITTRDNGQDCMAFAACAHVGTAA